MRSFISLFFVFSFILGFAQSKKASKFEKTITEIDLKSRLSVLASDSLEGRNTGSEGQKKAAQFIATHFKNIGLQGPVSGSYFQEFPLIKIGWGNIYLKKGEEVKTNLKDFVYQSSSITDGEESIDLIFLGDSITTQEDVTGKFLVMNNQNWNESKANLRKLNKEGPAGYVLVGSQQKELDFVFGRMKPFYERVLIKLDEPENRFNISSVNPEKIFVTGEDMVSWLFGKPFEELRFGDRGSALLNVGRRIEEFTSENVLGYLPGSEKPDEILVITSHYDHIGIQNGQIYNGADDDGSGTSAVMELAEAFATAAKKNRGPSRSILFMCFSGEEKGLLGSKFYSENPVFPMENTVTDLNIDMIGRVDKPHQDKPNYVYVIGSDRLSQDLHNLSEKVNRATLNLAFDYKYNDINDPERFYYRSDHYNFARKGVPIIFYFNGTHDDYHQPTDTIDKIQFDILRKRTALIFFTAWEVANREERIRVD